MIPILFEGTETSFATNGIGRLADAIACDVIEERNGLYELEMQYPVNGVFYNEITEGRIILAVPFDGGTSQPFTIYQITRPLNQIVTVKAQHISYMLSGIVAMPFTASSCVQALSNIGLYSSTTNPFTFSTDKEVSANFKLDVPTAARAILAGSSGSILDTYGSGDYEFNRFNVILHADRGADNGVTLRYGKNITDIKSVIDMTSAYTGIVPYWADYDGNLVTLTESVVLSEHTGDYPYKIIKPVDFSDKWEDAPTEAQLRAAATAYVASNEGWKLKNNITVSFVALWNTEEYKNIAALERVKMCDVVHIIFPSLGVNVAAKVIKTNYDVLQERYNSITVGDSYNSFSSMFTELSAEVKASEKSQKSYIQKAVDHATDLISGGLGGHVVLSRNSNGEPEEILIMDTDDISTANKVWRWNVNGLGYSEHGYQGPYGTAITMDGEIVADYITAGTMEANRVRAGLLTDEQGDNYWNLSTGEFSLSANATVGGSTVSSIASSAASSAVTAFENGTYATFVTNTNNALNGKITTYYQTSAPTTTITGDLWIDTDDGNKLYRWNGSSWVSVQDAGIQSALSAASNAQTTADGKIVTFAQASQPTATDVGDLWIDTDDNNKLYRWSGTQWVAYSDSSALQNWISNTYNSDKTTMEGLIDGKAETWYQSADPSSAWTTTDLKDAHVGDLWYNTTNQTTWFYQKSGSTYSWVQEIVPTAVFDKIDGKARVFITQPIPPYSVGDLWFGGTSSDIKTCTTARASGSYTATDWEKYDKYVDSSDISTAITAYDTALNQSKVFNKLTNNGALQGIYMQNNNLYINASYIASGTIADTSGNTSWNLTTGALSSKKFSVQSNNFILTETGDLTAKNATLNGSFHTEGDIRGIQQYDEVYDIANIKDGKIELKSVQVRNYDKEDVVATYIGSIGMSQNYRGDFRITGPNGEEILLYNNSVYFDAPSYLFRFNNAWKHLRCNSSTGEAYFT